MLAGLDRMRNFMGKLQQEKKRRHINVKPIIESYIDKGKDFNYKKINIENYFFVKKKNKLFQNDFQELSKIYKEVKNYILFLEEDLKNEKRAKIWGKDYLENLITNLNDFKKNMIDFAKSKKIILDISEKAEFKANLKDKSKINEILENFEKEEKELKKNEYYLTRDIEYDRKRALFKNLMILEKKLESIEKIVGEENEKENKIIEEIKEENNEENNEENKEEKNDKEENILNLYKNEKEDLKLITISEMRKNNEKLKIVGDELLRMAKDRKMNYFQAQQKRVLKKFLIDFEKKIDEENQKDFNVVLIYNKFKDNMKFLENVSAVLNKIEVFDNLLGKYNLENGENFDILENLEASLKKNIEVLDKNEKIIKQ